MREYKDILSNNKFDKYYSFLVTENEKYNLTAITDKDDVYIKHFADSLLGLEYIQEDATVCDIGTGAGFPGIVLKIFKPNIKLYLVDSVNKKIEFLDYLIKELDLDNINTIHARVEDKEFKDKYLNYFDIVTARAVANIGTLTEYCLPFVKIGGKFIAYKTNEINNELNNNYQHIIEQLGGSSYSIFYKKLDNYAERSFVFVEKSANTSNKFPRGLNKPRISPLK